MLLWLKELAFLFAFVGHRALSPYFFVGSFAHAFLLLVVCLCLICAAVSRFVVLGVRPERASGDDRCRGEAEAGLHSQPRREFSLVDLQRATHIETSFSNKQTNRPHVLPHHRLSCTFCVPPFLASENDLALTFDFSRRSNDLTMPSKFFWLS